MHGLAHDMSDQVAAHGRAMEKEREQESETRIQFLESMKEVVSAVAKGSTKSPDDGPPNDDDNDEEEEDGDEEDGYGEGEEE